MTNTESLQEFHNRKYLESVELENWERAEHHDKQYTKLVTSEELSKLQKVLLFVLLLVSTSPLWLFGITMLLK